MIPPRFHARAHLRAAPFVTLLVSCAAILAVPVLGAEADDEQKLRRQIQLDAQALARAMLPGVAGVSAGWTMGVSGDAVDPQRDRPGNEKLDLAPYFHLNLGFGSGETFHADAKLVLANFGRLINATKFQGFSAETSGTSVRRALIVDFTVRSPTWVPWRNAGILVNLLNTGFILDADDDPEDQEVMDAASYLFGGVTFIAREGPATYAADLLVGISEVLTGDEVFDFSERSKPSPRIRPRVWASFENGLGADRPLEVGFWGDLGTERGEADAVTAFIATRIFPAR